MQKRRKLADLYVRGKTITIDDGQGDPFPVWVQKLNPVDHAAAVKAADAARARVLASKKNKDSEDYQAMLSDVLSADKEVLVAILSAVERLRLLPVVEAEVATDKEWAEDNYLEGLRDAWSDELEERFIDDPDDAEAKRVHDELDRFLHIVDQNVQRRIDDHEEALNDLPPDDLQEAALAHNIKTAGDLAWVAEYHHQCVYFAARDNTNHSVKLFDSRAEVNDVQEEVFTAINDALREVTVEPVEGKDSAAAPPSSTSPESPDKEEAA